MVENIMHNIWTQCSQMALKHIVPDLCTLQSWLMIAPNGCILTRSHQPGAYNA